MNNREIKFEYGFESVNGIVKKVYHLHEIPFIKDKCDVWNVLPIKYVRQYTGLKDRNGVEIYEGDILEYISSNLFSLGEKIRLSVSYVQARFWCHGVNNGSNIGIYLAELIDTEKCKVIGNIHQNPELL